MHLASAALLACPGGEAQQIRLLVRTKDNGVHSLADEAISHSPICTIADQLDGLKITLAGFSPGGDRETSVLKRPERNWLGLLRLQCLT